MHKFTDEFSFVIKPSSLPNAGVGVFATHDIQQGTWLFNTGPIWTFKFLSFIAGLSPIWKAGKTFRNERKRRRVEMLSVNFGPLYIGPRRFDALQMYWYLNHSESPNVAKPNIFSFRAVKDIKMGDELFVDYQTLSPSEKSDFIFNKEKYK